MVSDIKKQAPSDIEEGGGEISLLDVLNMLRNSWKPIIVFGFLGLLGAIFYILVTPNSYEAISQIRMAQVSITSPSNPFGTSVEDPATLLARMQIPTNFSAEVVSACAYQEKIESALALSKEVKFSVVKGVPNVVELKVMARSPELAKKCSSAIFEAIKVSQAGLTAVFIEEAKRKLATDDHHIEAARKLIAKADQSGAVISVAYLSSRDELTFFLNDREKMVDLIDSAKNRSTSLISPIYVLDRPVSPKKISSLIVGLFTGVLLGLLVALGRQFWQIIKP